MKIFADIEQGSDAWRQLRLGIPTASNFAKIVTPKKCELSKSAIDYALRLCAERLLNATSESSIENPWVERGKILEADAARQYEFTFERQTIPVGFITSDDGSMGCSPDRLVLGEKRIAVEIKCPSPHVHLGYLLRGDMDDYKPQVQGQIMIAELDRAELFSYHPQMPAALIETAPEPDYIAKLYEALQAFNRNLAAMFERAQALGVYQPAARLAPAEAVELAELTRRFKAESGARMIADGFTVDPVDAVAAG